MEKSKTGLWDPNRPFRPDKSPFFYGWAIAVLGAIGMIASTPGQTIGVNVFSEKLIVDLELSRTQVSLAYMIGTTISGLSLPWVGVLYDRLGARKLVVLASLGLGFSLLYMSASDKIAHSIASLFRLDTTSTWKLCFLTFGFFLIRFWGQGMMTLTSRNMVGKWWVNHRGKVLSISGIAASICFSLTPKAADALIESIGWRESWQVIGVISILVMTTIGWFFFRDNPEECGLVADGGRPQQKSQRGNPEFSIKKQFTRKEALHSYSFWLFSLVFALQALYSTGYAFHVIDIARNIGMTKSAILNLFVPAAVLGATISLFVGWACDRWRLKHLIRFMATGCSLAPLGLIIDHPTITPVLIIIGFGIAGGCYGTISGAFIPRFYGLKHLGAISGFFLSLLVIASAIGPWLFSSVFDLFANYAPIHWTCFTSALLLATGAHWANNPQRSL